MVLGLVFWPRPARTAKLVALVLTKECADPRRTEICDPVCLGAGENSWVGQNHSVTVGPTLQVAQHELPARRVVGKVRECLHHPRPRRVIIGPTGVRVELLVALIE